jgi:D-aminopeptidase
MLGLPGNEAVRSINVVVAETNDGRLNDIRGRHVGREHVLAAMRAAAETTSAGTAVEEGAVGAGTGTVCFGWKGGIGTASRVVGPLTLGVLVQSNFGGSLTIAGVPVYKQLVPPPTARAGDGSCVIVVATDAPLDSRNLGRLARLARRALAGRAPTGSSFSHGSGDYVIAFSIAAELRVRADAGSRPGAAVLSDEAASPLFAAVIEATEEAILNSLFRATDVSSRFGSARAIPVEEVARLLGRPRR